MIGSVFTLCQALSLAGTKYFSSSLTVKLFNAKTGQNWTPTILRRKKWTSTSFIGEKWTPTGFIGAGCSGGGWGFMGVQFLCSNFVGGRELIKFLAGLSMGVQILKEI